MGEITVSVVGSKNPNWFDTHQIPKNAAYAIPDEAATRLMVMRRQRQEVFQYRLARVTTIVFQACSFNHSDISPFRINRADGARRLRFDRMLCDDRSGDGGDLDAHGCGVQERAAGDSSAAVAVPVVGGIPAASSRRPMVRLLGGSEARVRPVRAHERSATGRGSRRALPIHGGEQMNRCWVWLTPAARLPHGRGAAYLLAEGIFVEAGLGAPMTLRSLGSFSDLDAAIKTRHAAEPASRRLIGVEHRCSSRGVDGHRALAGCRSQLLARRSHPRSREGVTRVTPVDGDMSPVTTRAPFAPRRRWHWHGSATTQCRDPAP